MWQYRDFCAKHEQVCSGTIWDWRWARFDADVPAKRELQYSRVDYCQDCRFCCFSAQGWTNVARSPNVEIRAPSHILSRKRSSNFTLTSANHKMMEENRRGSFFNYVKRTITSWQIAGRISRLSNATNLVMLFFLGVIFKLWNNHVLANRGSNQQALERYKSRHVVVFGSCGGGDFFKFEWEQHTLAAEVPNADYKPLSHLFQSQTWTLTSYLHIE